MKRRKFFAACAGAVAGVFVPADVRGAPLHAYAALTTEDRWARLMGVPARMPGETDETLRARIFIDMGAIERVNIRVRVHT